MSKLTNKLLYFFSAIIILFAIFYAVMTYQMKTTPIKSSLFCEMLGVYPLPLVPLCLDTPKKFLMIIVSSGLLFMF